MITRRLLWLVSVLAVVSVFAAPGGAQKDYLSSLEADKVRDAEQPHERIKLFVLFAEDRLRKYQYELSRAGNDKRRAERVAALLDAYAGCMDDAAELMELGRMKQQDILPGVKLLQLKGKQFLAELERQAAAASESTPHREGLKDAITATHEALQEAEKAVKEIAPPPVRRKQ